MRQVLETRDMMYGDLTFSDWSILILSQENVAYELLTSWDEDTTAAATCYL